MGVREIRESLNLTREELLKRTENISLSTLQRIEKDPMKCNLKTAKEIADALGKTVDEAFFDKKTNDEIGLKISGEMPSEIIQRRKKEIE